MFTGNVAAPIEDLSEELIEELGDDFFLFLLLLLGDHDVDMDIAITRMAKTGDRKAALRL